LRHYAEHFPLVEVDATYYALPSVRNSLLWAQRTPPGFRCNIKAFSLLTGHPTRSTAVPADLRPAIARLGRAGYENIDPGLLDDVWHRFSSALEPLRRAHRLGTLLFQFPPWFGPDTQAEAFLEQCRKRAATWPVAVEFRHPGWWRGDQQAKTSALLTQLGIAAVAVDMAQTLPTSMGPVIPVTSDELAMVRFHGRSAAWGFGTKEDRFRHTYSAEELAEWVPRIHAMAERTAQLHVLFNNCCDDAAVRAAESMKQLLGQ
jgi:uncharacterized protein YecE (DUF72 family)